MFDVVIITWDLLLVVVCIILDGRGLWQPALLYISKACLVCECIYICS